MLQEIMLPLKPLCALGAIPLSQTRQVFSSLAFLVLCEMFGGFQISVDLVKVSACRISTVALQQVKRFPIPHLVRRLVLLLLIEPMIRCSGLEFGHCLAELIRV